MHAASEASCEQAHPCWGAGRRDRPKSKTVSCASTFSLPKQPNAHSHLTYADSPSFHACANPRPVFRILTCPHVLVHAPRLRRGGPDSPAADQLHSAARPKPAAASASDQPRRGHHRRDADGRKGRGATTNERRPALRPTLTSNDNEEETTLAHRTRRQESSRVDTSQVRTLIRRLRRPVAFGLDDAQHACCALPVVPKGHRVTSRVTDTAHVHSPATTWQPCRVVSSRVLARVMPRTSHARCPRPPDAQPSR